MTQGKYISESAQELIRRSEQILGNVSILDLTDQTFPQYLNGDDDDNDDSHNDHSPGYGSISSCNRIVLKNVITVTDSSIIICTGTAISTCSPQDTCPTGGIVAPNKYINMVATVNLNGVTQTGVVIQFNYLINDIPITDPSLTRATANLVPGDNIVYLFPTNRSYDPDTSITLYGASIV